MKILIFALVGLAAQMVDGALGMAFGVTATTLLIFSGLGPAHASAAVHFAELGTTLFSGLSHWRLRNVHWPTVVALGVPGAIGAFAGAYLLSNLSTKAAEPVVSTILVLLGAYVLVRSVAVPWRRADKVQPASTTRRSRLGLSVLGLTGGFLDASGGGGWGPVTTSTLMSVGKDEPRRIIGTVNTAEFLVAASASAGFIVGMSNDLVQSWQPVLGLLIGGAIAAPIAAWAVTVIKPEVLGAVVGALLMFLNSTRLINYFGFAGVVAVLLLGLAVVVALVLVRKRSLLARSLAGDDAGSDTADSTATDTTPEPPHTDHEKILAEYRYK
ncbi:sulfite exporter TauE/SafE family protein [Corynebacterium falsenii]|uniref:Probable membrane transporter protein n=1 Tax=Corynebacterium falsenii TaxID=108486 RepID=A0A418Q4W9_9CORY|nr:sulfite exporter TauE/SafE family protein [Corynebacterium falsenii]AHI02457.1 membrane protein [Corynebacterium falsenii DSM 44353]MDC7104246.1 sulfite exporter TauE/SafE family protein [Corynebacterium falsenii]RIX33463.1 sulfite exporter TauE/SafE family protein [Corynebacterium falsenii]UBI05235.1 sulfite exporter TauE/SafE family protein [Corynebacterium falsenii]HJF11801.1 sulfite exporter TauE/SafE family protein [Corynebacterium falsenii]